MSWHPNDLLTDADLRDYEAAVMTSFGQTSWQAKRTKALEDWLFPILKAHGFDPFKLVTRAEPAQVFGYTSSVYTDKTGDAKSTTEDDLNLAAVFASVGSDALYVGSKQPFKGLFFRMSDSVSSATGVMTVAYWNGNWEALTIDDKTVQTAGKTLSAGGSVTWLLPVDWQTRAVNSSNAYYWVKVTLSATPTSAKAAQVSPIRSSSLRAPATFRTLELIFREAPTFEDGPWLEKADYYKGQADDALQRALTIVGGEFDTDQSDQISETEEGQTEEEAGGGPWVLQRA